VLLQVRKPAAASGANGVPGMKCRFIQVERRGDVYCVRLVRGQLGEAEIEGLVGELQALVTNEGCRKLALSLGPRPPEFLYSVFLAKLIHLQRMLNGLGGRLAVCEAGEEVVEIFTSCHLKDLFTFLPDFDAAVAHLSS
jgi:hypothetical protein